MTKTIVSSYDEADEKASEDTDAGYVNWIFTLTDEDIESLKNGKYVLFTDIEYGIVLGYGGQVEESGDEAT